MSDVYFEPSSMYDPVKHGDKAVVYIFSFNCRTHSAYCMPSIL